MKVIIDYPKGKKFRKVKVVIHSKDLWSAHVTLAYVIHPVLVKCRNLYNSPTQMTSFPASFLPENFPELSEEEYRPIQEEALRKWIATLDTMIYAFYWIISDNTFGPHGPEIHKELDEAVRVAKKDKKLFRSDFRMDCYGPVFDKWKPQLDEHEAKIKEGLRLFAEYYQSLWT